MTWKQTARRLTLCGLAGCLFVWLWFRPVFWNMTETRDGFWVALWDIFIWPSTPEYMLGAGVDQLGTFWIFGSLPEIIGNDGVLPSIFHPIGWDIGWHTGYAWLDGILSLPLQFLGVPAFYNLHVALTLWLSFMGICWLFTRTSTKDAIWILAPVIAALALWTPFGFEEISMGRPTQMYWFFSLLFMGLLCQPPSEKHQWIHSVAVGLSLTAACFVYWFGGVAIGFCGGLVVLCQIFQQSNRKRFIIRNLVSGVIAVGTSILLAHNMIIALWNGDNHFEQLATTPVAYFGLFDLPIYDSIRIHSSNHMMKLLHNHPSTTPILCLGVLGWLIPYGWKERWPWLVGWIVSLGIPITGAIVIDDWILPTGQSLLQWIFPLLLRCEYPERMVVAPTVLSIVVFAHAFSALMNHVKQTRTIWIGSALVAVILGWIATPPAESDLKVSSFVIDEVRMHVANNFPGGMIDVPFSRSENTYIQQLFHRQPLLGGPGLNRVQPPAHVEYCQQNGLLMSLEELDQYGSTSKIFTTQDIKRLIEDGFSVLVYDPQTKRISATDLEAFLGVSPDFIDDRTGIRAYTLDTLLKQYP